MKSFILPFVIALLAGVGVAGGTAVLTSRPAPVPAKADSAKQLATDTSAMRVIDSTGTVTAPAGAVPSAEAVSAPVAHGDSSRKHDAAPAGKPAPVLAAPRVAVPETHATTPVSASLGGAPASPGARQPAVTKAAASVANASAAEAAPGEKRIARVIAAMAPRDAAKMLTQMADHDVAIIIGNLTEKQEAAILSQLPAERLAAISKLALRPAPAPK